MPIPVNFPNMVMTLLWMKNKGIILVRTGQMRAIIVVQWCSMQGGWNMTRFNSLSLKLTTVYCVCLSLCSWPKGPNCGIVRIGVKNLWSGPIDAVLSLSANCKPLLSAGQSDAEAPWWIQACGGYKLVSSGVCPYIQSAQRSTHTSTHTRTHPRWKIFPWVSSVSLCSTNSLVICGRKKQQHSEHLFNLVLRECAVF